MRSCLAIAVAILLSWAPAQAGWKSNLPGPLYDSDFHFNGSYDDNQVELGGMLFFDKVLSGNLNISCGTCHSPITATGDGLALGVGEGGAGLGISRNLGDGDSAVPARVPRNAPALFNRHHRSFTSLFHDGRVERDESHPSGFATPAGELLPAHLDNEAAVQSMFPVASADEMAGQPGENTQADLVAAGDLVGVWEHIAAKVRAIPEYVEMFKSVYSVELKPDTPVYEADDITYVHIANAIANWEGATLRSDNTPFDRYLRATNLHEHRNDRRVLSGAMKKGMKLFFGKARCSECHSGQLLTDHAFHAIGMPQIGPGAGDGPDGREDYGRERVSGDMSERYKFRTPPLRNIALTFPYGHAGAYTRLEDAVSHHLDTVASIGAYDPAREFDNGAREVTLPSRADIDALDFVVMSDPARVAAIAAASELGPTELKDKEFVWLMDFLVLGLTDPKVYDLRHIFDLGVPSGLPVFD